MKIFAVKDASGICKDPLMWLVYSHVGRTFFIELPDEADPLNIPMPLDSLYKKGIRTIGSEESMRWVRLRIVPPDRQNIAQILSDLKLQAYDEFRLLEYTHGRCPHDDYYITKTSESKLPQYLKDRLAKRVKDVMPMDGFRLAVFFRNGETKVCDLRWAAERPEFCGAARGGLAGVSVLYEGYGAGWGTGSTEVLYDRLYSSGVSVPISYDDILGFVKNRLADAAETAEMLTCSPQNVNAMRKRGTLTPVAAKKKYSLYLKSDIEQLRPA